MIVEKNRMKLESAISERDVGSGSLSYAQHTENDIIIIIGNQRSCRSYDIVRQRTIYGPTQYNCSVIIVK